MFIKLTNAAQNMKDEVLILRKDIIVSVFESEVELLPKDIEDNVFEVEEQEKEKVTVLFCGTSGTWQVKESPEEVYNLL